LIRQNLISEAYGSGRLVRSLIFGISQKTEDIPPSVKQKLIEYVPIKGTCFTKTKFTTLYSSSSSKKHGYYPINMQNDKYLKRLALCSDFLKTLLGANIEVYSNP
jgi:hypothetical protein